MNWIATIAYLLTFIGSTCVVCAAVASTPIMWPFLFLLFPMGGWAAFDIYFIWND